MKSIKFNPHKKKKKKEANKRKELKRALKGEIRNFTISGLAVLKIKLKVMLFTSVCGICKNNNIKYGDFHATR